MNEQIDFSSIDPKQDELRWENMVSDVVKRASAVRTGKDMIWGQVLLWAKPAIAAAAVALLSLAGLALSLSGNSSDDITGRVEPALVVSSWAAGDTQPETQNILSIFGDYNVDD